jgi:uncharacterized membrane protein YkoI
MSRWGLLLWLVLACSAPVSAREPHRAKLSMDEARAIALRTVPGKIVHAELENEKGRWIYSIEVRPEGERGRRVKEVNIDADSGAIVEVATEVD